MAFGRMREQHVVGGEGPPKGRPSTMSATERTLIEKIRQLSPMRLAEVEDFVDFLCVREEQRLTQAAAKASEPSFSKLWDNDEDAAYDRL